MWSRGRKLFGGNNNNNNNNNNRHQQQDRRNYNFGAPPRYNGPNNNNLSNNARPLLMSPILPPQGQPPFVPFPRANNNSPGFAGNAPPRGLMNPGNMIGNIIQRARDRVRTQHPPLQPTIRHKNGPQRKLPKNPQNHSTPRDSPANHQNNTSRKRTHGAASSSSSEAEERIPVKRTRTEETEESEFKQLSEQAHTLVENNSQTEELLDKKQRLRSVLLSVIRKQFPNVSLHLVGSSCNGFASDSSDADFCVMFSQTRKVNQRNEACRYLSAIQKLIRPITSLKGIQLIRAKVPILKFRDAISGCECDVNINNPVGIRNTHLLRTYSKMDPRVRPMVMAVKKWAGARGINDASQGTLSSYSLVLMILHYLQCGANPPVLKSLQKEYPNYFRVDSDVDELPMFEATDEVVKNTTKNTQSVGQLLEGFFHYFAEVFSWDTLIISVREARTLAIKNYPQEFRDKYICIEEPFERTNTSRAVHEYNKFQLIKKEFHRAYDRLQDQLSLPYIS